MAQRDRGQGGRILSRRWQDYLEEDRGWQFIAPRYNGRISFIPTDGRPRDIGVTRLDDGRIHHVAVVYEIRDPRSSDGQMTAYLDGEVDGTVQIGRVRPYSGAQLVVGSGTGNHDRFRGEFWGVRVFGRAASRTEVRMLADRSQQETRIAVANTAVRGGSLSRANKVFEAFKAGDKYSGNPQKFGQQFDVRPDGPSPCARRFALCATTIKAVGFCRRGVRFSALCQAGNSLLRDTTV